MGTQSRLFGPSPSSLILYTSKDQDVLEGGQLGDSVSSGNTGELTLGGTVKQNGVAWKDAERKE